MKINLKYIILSSIFLLLLASCSLNEDIEPASQPKSKGEFTRLSPFDTRLMDLTTYLISIDKALEKGKKKGLDYGRLMWGTGYSYKTNEREYTVVPFSPDGDKLISLVATKKDGEFVVFIRESPIEEKAGTNINGRVILKSVTGIELYSQWYQDGELLTEAESSFTRLKSGDLEFGNMLPEVIVYGTDMSSGNSNNDWGNSILIDVENVYPDIDPTLFDDVYDYTGGGGGSGGYDDANGGGYDNNITDGGGSSSNSNNSFYPAYMQAKQANLTITQISTNKLQIMSPRLDFIENSELVQYPDYSGYFYIYSGYWIYYDVYGENQSIWIENNYGVGQWYDFEFDTPNLAGELTSIIAQIPVELSKQLVRYALPIEDAYIVWTGVDFDGIEQSRWWAAGGIILSVVPGSKALKPVAKIGGSATRFFAGLGKSLIELRVVNGVVRFSDDAVRALVTKATKNPLARKVMLGKYWENGVSYVTEAGTDYCYYSLDNWNDILSLVNNNRMEMWKINKQYLDNMFRQGKEFYMSHDPDLATDFFKDEIDYIKNLPGFVRFEQEGKYWRAIFN